MNTFKKVLSLTLIVIFIFSSAIPSYAASNNLNDYSKNIYEEGMPVFTTEDFLTIFNSISSFINFLNGNGFEPAETYNVIVDDFVTDACNRVYESCGLDIVSLLKAFPAGKLPVLLSEGLNVDTIQLRNAIFEVRDKYEAEGNRLMVMATFMLASYLSNVQECVVCGIETENPDVKEVVLNLTYYDGGKDTMHPGIFINTVTGQCTNKDGTGLLSTGFEFNLNEMLVYATINAWMRNFGFCVFYDIAANSMPLLWRYETRRFMFDYDGREWMIQIWKGNYLITNGAEVGVYNRESERFGTFYDCASDDELMMMSLQVYHGDELLVNQEPQMHWWINGFNMSHKIYIPKTLTMKFSIEMQDEEMLNSFCNSIDRHYKKDVEYTVDGLTVNVIW